ncbi:DUF4488 domain-containing protein [Mucilaginibacter sp. UR6-11]|uniref:DUF4488 domain-containing protein n=1 Tax=Mucilaginibacter sp. UR6-11 TaxID=1435644 RepID=UPI001E46243F|nr:DUF4488 domain-containing protein [Mucilaginibacter sp. UR6-11]MCC8424102.1 DUF4488 domain-containing protein [Mucilaginibacter sp. UR6-11]
MKSILKIATALLALQLLAITTFAQTGNKTFTGIWELAQSGPTGSALQNAGPGYLKIFNADSTFANVQIRNTGAIISHSGKYTVDDAQNYTETASYRIPEMGGGPLGNAFKLKYKFSEDAKMIQISYVLENGIAATEIWRKL